jgi:hypothetical protein
MERQQVRAGSTAGAPRSGDGHPTIGGDAPTTTVIWIHDGPVCVTVVDPPAPHASSGICRCPACRAHDPDVAVSFV